MNENLFNEFDEVSAKQWKQKIQFDLKGADYNEKLVWKSPDGIHVKPFYHLDDAPEALQINSPLEWNIAEKIYVASAEITNAKAREVLQKGAESLWFLIPSEETDLKALFKELPVSEVPIFLTLQFASEDFLRKLQEAVPEKSKIYIQFDIFGNFARSGNWFKNRETDFKILENLLQKSENFESVISVDVSLYQNAGATIPQQLAYAMAHVNEYFNFLSEKTSANQKVKIQFLVSVGPNYFFEIAKLRALRLLFQSLASEYSFNADCEILAQPTRRNKTLYDYNVNLLRTTTECMSAVLGGANTVCNMAYDAVYHKNNDFGSRIARNQLLILKHESYFEKAANPAEGSYYIESLTHEMADKALDIFKDIEKGGGFLEQLMNGTLQKKIAESAAREQQEFDSENLVLIGTNKFPNREDMMNNELELYPFIKQKPRKTLISPILERRLSEEMELQRLKEEGSSLEKR